MDDFTDKYLLMSQVLDNPLTFDGHFESKLLRLFLAIIKERPNSEAAKYLNDWVGLDMRDYPQVKVFSNGKDFGIRIISFGQTYERPVQEWQHMLACVDLKT